MNSNQVIEASGLSDRDLITAIVSNFFIVDYGYITKVNADKTINVTHAKKSVMIDGTELPETTTKNIEVLTFAGAGFSITWDYKAGDKVLLLGLKDYIKKVDDVSKAEKPQVFVHYNRATLKAIPMCIFDDNAKVSVEIEDGSMTIKAKDKVKIDADQKIELNGNSKQFVTWIELNTHLQSLLTSLKGHTHAVSGAAAGPSADLATVVLDLSDAKTTTVVTGG